jgi:flagellar basal body rod protein FlgF
MIIVDRIEGTTTVCEEDDEQLIIENQQQLREIVHEGDVLIRNDDGTYSVDREMTQKRREYILELQRKLWDFD